MYCSQVQHLQMAEKEKKLLRPTNATSNDQRRVTTLRQALAEGSDYVVIGRPIIAADDRLGALKMMIEDTKQ